MLRFLEMSEEILECLNSNILKKLWFMLIRLIKQFKRVKISLFLLTDRFILGQVIPKANVLKNIGSYEFAANKVKLIRPIYNTNTGLSKWSRKLFLTLMLEVTRIKNRILILFSRTVFMKHMSEMLNGKTNNFCRLFYFLPSTTDKKKEMNQHLGNVSLHVIDCV